MKENKVWRMWKIDLLLLPLMWFINGAPVGGPSTWMDGVGDATIATYAGMFAALIPAVHMLRHAHIGQVISVAIFTWSKFRTMTRGAVVLTIKRRSKYRVCVCYYPCGIRGSCFRDGVGICLCSACLRPPDRSLVYFQRTNPQNPDMGLC